MTRAERKYMRRRSIIQDSIEKNDQKKSDTDNSKQQ